MVDPLSAKLQAAVSNRSATVNLMNPKITRTDLFSNDYLSLCSNPTLRSNFLKRLATEPDILGSGGSRLLVGNTNSHVALETRLREYYDAPAALIFNTGYEANISIFDALPQRGDAIVYDELMHRSALEGMRSSRAASSLHSFEHNSVVSLKTVLRDLLQSSPEIRSGSSTVFVALETVYSMDGDIAPLTELVEAVEQILPNGCGQIVIDEAHSTGLYGRGGRGIVSHFGLDERVAIRLHVFSKAIATSGAVVLSSPLIRTYLINFSRPIMFTTAPSRMCLFATEASLDMIEGEVGDQLRERLFGLCRFARRVIEKECSSIPSSQYGLPAPSSSGLVSPMIPVVTPHAIWIASELRRQGWAAIPVIHPAVAKGEERIRLTIHAGNTEKEIEEFVRALAACIYGAVHRKRGDITCLVIDAQPMSRL